MRTDSGKNTLVSVIMPVYNQATTLDLSISSICNQTFGDWELILVDDCSTDGSSHIMKKKSVNDSRIKIIKNKENFGLAKSLNIGVSNSKGKYIARMDADDISDLNRLKIQVNVLESSSVDVLGSNAVLINSDGYDIGVTDLIYPTGMNCGLSSFDSIIVLVRNFGSDTVTSFNINYSISQSPYSLNPVNETILPGANKEILLSNNFNFSTFDFTDNNICSRKAKIV